jgi:hypothetical protein
MEKEGDALKELEALLSDSLRLPPALKEKHLF